MINPDLKLKNLAIAGKVAGAEGIISVMGNIKLETSSGTEISTLPTSQAFTVNTSTGQITNDNALVFLIASDDITKVATQVSIYRQTTSALLMTIDLDSTLTINYAGEVTIAAGNLKVTL